MTALRDWIHLVTDVGDLKVKRTREATPEERVELARELDILDCDALKVSYTLTPLGRDRFQFEGLLEAAVKQACVVSLEPVAAEISEPFSVEFGPPEAFEDEAPSGDREVLSIPDVEPITDGRIEVGTVVFGLLSAALPQYPKKAGAEFDWVDPKAADPEKTSPFAELAKLKPKP
jgi:uncharacterized metal-binding protein YceD (DUF177 family)